MNVPEPPKFQWGQRVSAAGDLFNDGSFPERPADALLVQAGDAGEIVQMGTHVETGTHIYLVEFGERLVVGCLEGELRSGSAKRDSAAENPRSSSAKRDSAAENPRSSSAKRDSAAENPRSSSAKRDSAAEKAYPV